MTVGSVWDGVWARLARHAPMLSVLGVVMIAMERVLTQHWRQGSVLLAAALLLTATLRLALPAERIGLLAIRSRVLDVLCYGVFGAAMLLLAITITHSPLAVD